MRIRLEDGRLNRVESPLAVRAEQLELMDDLANGGQELRAALVQLSWINRLLGAAWVTLEGVRELWLAAGRPAHLHIMDVGAGAGDINHLLLRWADLYGIHLRITLLDQHPETCQHAAHRFRREPRVSVEQGDLRQLERHAADLITASLVLHHLPTAQVPWTLLHLRQASYLGVVINDLHRHPMAEASISLLTQLLSRNPLIRHDAPLSVRRGFRAHEWAELRSYPGLEGLSWRWRPAFRYLVILPGEAMPCRM